ncbi:unnamed protein product [Rhizoctonia solani]|uniref:Uncharacterized protein n=1 Tax=Rhizoctonia solani TaxID=456999 RepID=A0A8H3EAC3_9AGAM|nr:unnamed protein product [Rhizoctonia solani]
MHQLSNIHSPTRSRDEMVTAAKKKLKTFRAKQVQSSVSSVGSVTRRRTHSRGNSITSTTDVVPPSLPVAIEAPRHHQKRRSNPRSVSILKPDTASSSPAMAFSPPPKPANLGDLNRSFSFGGPRPASSPMVPPPPSSPPCSQQPTTRPRASTHHRRRSSVSTRRDSVDMMGFDPAALSSLKTMGENDKDEVSKIREHALLALEGKTPTKARTVPEIVSNLGFTKVEIPEWKTPDVERTFEWGATNRPMSVPFSINLNSASTIKRDSFGKSLVPSASSKGELAVLVEEEEEEEALGNDKENVPLPQPAALTPESVSTPINSPIRPSFIRSPSLSPSRPRPASLNLKALTMVPSTTVVSLPTPSATPSPTPGARPGMKPLNLGNATRRQSMIALSSNSSRNSLPASRRQSLRSQSRDSGSTHSSKDSLSAAIARLPPTPSTMSPTSAVEGFLQKNQEVLISRIDQLEKALASSRRASMQSNMSHSSTASSIAEEQINLIAELKGERNSLLEEIAGWRTRVEDLERQAGLYLNKIDSERTETKLACERVQELEKEQSTWESDRKAFNDAISRAREDSASWRSKYEEALKGECHWQAKALGLESDVKRLEKELAAFRTATPVRKWNVAVSPRRFDDSMSSTSTADVRDEAYAVSSETEVVKIRPRAMSPLLNMGVVVEEEEDEAYESSHEEPVLEDDEPRCVEEDEDDVSSDILGTLMSSYPKVILIAAVDEVNGDLSDSESLTSQYTQPQQPTFFEPQPSFKFPGAFPDPAPAFDRGHARTGSMIKGWQMPRGPVQGNGRSPAKPDRFFDQLEQLYAASDEEPTTPTNPSFETFRFGSPEFSTFKGDGGASSFRFGSRRNSISNNFRGHGTRASRGSISVAAFNGLGMPPFMNPKPEWVVKNESPEPLSPLPGAKMNTDRPLGSNTVAHLQAILFDGEACLPAQESEDRMTPALGDPERTPTMAKPPRFIAAPTTTNTLSTIKTVPTSTSAMSSPRTTNSSCTSTTSTRALVRRKPSLTRAQPTGRTPPQVPANTSHDVSRSPFSVSYSRTSSRSSRHDSIVGAEAAAIEAAIAQAQAVAAASRRLTFTGLASLLPWGMISGAGGESTQPLRAVVEGGAKEEDQTALLVPKTSGTVTREAQLERLRRELEVAGQPVVGVNTSAPCCSRCKTDVIEL